MKFFTEDIRKGIPQNVTIVAATKYFTAAQMRELYQTGISHFGENRVEALLEKLEPLESLDITWHFIGTLQTKKVKKIIHKIDYLHSLNTMKLAEEINKRRTSPLKCFIQVNISNEESKHGLKKEEVLPFLTALEPLENIQVIGFMGMAEYTNNEALIEKEFQVLNDLQEDLRKQQNIELTDLSIGMSNDYKIALKHNSTYLRLGSVLFKKEVS